MNRKKLDNIQSNIEECTQAVEDGKNEIIEILNSRANTKGKAQRFDAMMEQLDIRKAGISQRMLSLKTQEEEQTVGHHSGKKKEYDTITESIQAIREEGSNLTKEIKAIQENPETAEYRAGRKPESLPQRGFPSGIFKEYYGTLRWLRKQHPPRHGAERPCTGHPWRCGRYHPWRKTTRSPLRRHWRKHPEYCHRQ